MAQFVLGSGSIWVVTAILAAGGCGGVDRGEVPTDAPVTDGADVDGAPQAMLGTMANPARTCAELAVAGMPSAVYWVRDPADEKPALQVYCEQQLNGGGWALVANSVRRDDGTTTAFWQLTYNERLSQLGTLAPDQNYYNGSLYLIGTTYMDVFVDLADTTRMAAMVSATGIDRDTMRFTEPMWLGGNNDVYRSQFAGGWSAQNYDGDTDPDSSCAVDYENIAQHYSACWVYNFGADATEPRLDGGVGPHVADSVMTALGLAIQPGSNNYSQVKRIARFTRW